MFPSTGLPLPRMLLLYCANQELYSRNLPKGNVAQAYVCCRTTGRLLSNRITQVEAQLCSQVDY